MLSETCKLVLSTAFPCISVSEFNPRLSLWSRELYKNNIQGTIPSELGNLKSLISLDLYNNNISGIIPPSLGKLKSLVFLWVYRVACFLSHFLTLWGLLTKWTFFTWPFTNLFTNFPHWLKNFPNHLNLVAGLKKWPGLYFEVYFLQHCHCFFDWQWQQ